MAMEWKRETDVIAQRFGMDEIPGTFTKELLAKDNEFVVLERGNEIYREVGPGRFSVSSIGTFTSLLFLDKSEKLVEKALKNVWLDEGARVIVKFSMKFRISHPDRFSKNLMRERRVFITDDVWNEILSDLIYDGMIPRLKRESLQQLRRDDFRRSVTSVLEKSIGNMFSKWGIVLISLSVDFELPRRTESESKVEDFRPQETESYRKTAEYRDAGRLRSELEELKKSKKIAEKKFYSKDLPEEAFKVIIEDFNRKISEIESKLKEST